MLQFATIPQPTVQTSFTETDGFLNMSIFAVLLLLVIAIIFIIRSVTRSAFKIKYAFDRTVLHIMVPKEKKSEGANQNSNNEERLDQVKEEIGITETVFATIAGLKAERGVYRWFKGRNDHFSFEMVVHDGLINFYVAVPHKLRGFIEQQINAQYPYAQIEEIPDYNIFTSKSSIAGAYISGKLAGVLPFKSYKKMDSDPLSSMLNVLARIKDQNSSAAIQLIVRSAHRKWRRRGVRIVREVRKGEKFEHVIHRSMFGKIMKSIGRGVA